ncbi:phospholipase-like protein [Tanacetum coccineum]
MFTTPANSSFFDGAQMTPTHSTMFEQPMSFGYPSSHTPPHIMTPMAQQGFSPWSSISHAIVARRPQYGPTHNFNVGGVIPDVMHHQKREIRPSKFVQSPYTSMPDTMVAPKKRADTNRNTMTNAKVSSFNLENAAAKDVLITGSRATDDCISFYNVDPNKVTRENYIDYLTFINSPEPVYLDCHIRGFTVEEQFWRELVPLLCRSPNYKEHYPNQSGWLSDDQMNSWMELLIRTRPPGARHTMAKSRTASMHPGSKMFVIETDEHIKGMLDGSSRPYPSWDEVYMPINSGGDHWVTGVINLPNSTIHILDSLPCQHRIPKLRKHISQWNKLVNYILQKVSHFERTRRQPYDFQVVYNDGWKFSIPRQGNCNDCGVVTCWVIENLCRGQEPIVHGDPTNFFSNVRVNMLLRLYECRCEDTSECG